MYNVKVLQNNSHDSIRKIGDMLAEMYEEAPNEQSAHNIDDFAKELAHTFNDVYRAGVTSVYDKYHI